MEMFWQKMAIHLLTVLKKKLHCVQEYVKITEEGKPPNMVCYQKRIIQYRIEWNKYSNKINISFSGL
jgi:hypothetical protein